MVVRDQFWKDWRSCGSFNRKRWQRWRKCASRITEQLDRKPSRTKIFCVGTRSTRHSFCTRKISHLRPFINNLLCFSTRTHCQRHSLARTSICVSQADLIYWPITSSKFTIGRGSLNGAENSFSGTTQTDQEIDKYDEADVLNLIMKEEVLKILIEDFELNL